MKDKARQALIIRNGKRAWARPGDLDYPGA